MTIPDFEFAHGAAIYLTESGLSPDETSEVLESELGCSPDLASVITEAVVVSSSS